ncbi:MAG: CHASE2 domain-containing protein [Deltaproteobacteria bacterium]|nr:CHASE2 domain-containing protein [Deltaproteobacteria bacterium]
MALGGSSGRGLRAGGSGLLAGTAALVLVGLIGRLGGLEAAELAVLDRFVRAGAAGAEASQRVGADGVVSPVVVVPLGEADFARHGHPLPDRQLAALLERLADLGASAIGVDLYRSAPANASAEAVAGFAALAQAVERHPQIVMTELLASSEAPGLPAPDFAPAPQVGFNNMLVDPGRVVRRGSLYSWDDDGRAHVSLALRLASLHLAAAGIGIEPDPKDPELVRIGGTTLAPLEANDGVYVRLDAGGFQIPLDFRRDPARFESLSLEAVLGDRAARERVEGRVVVIGTDAPSVKDDFDSPLAPDSIVKGLRLHAQLADQLIRAGVLGDAPRQSASQLAEAGLVGAFGAGAIALAMGVGPLARVVPGLLAGLLLPVFFAAFLFQRGLVVPSVEPTLAWAAAGGASLVVRVRAEARAQRQLVSLFRRFSSAKVADALWRERDRIMSGGRPRPRRLVLTALMSDLVGFTSAAEKLEPEDLLAWIDVYMDAMTRVIEAHGGHVDDYVGDGIKANFGVPIPSESEAAIARDARQAVACALAMGRALEECNRVFAAKGWPLARQRIGIETGLAVVGAIGSDARMKYTSVGDTINTAARLESFTEPDATAGDEGPTRILVGDATRRLLGEGFEVEEVGVHALKGKRAAIGIHRIVAARDGGEGGA